MDGTAIVAGVIVTVVAAAILAVGGWFFRDRLGWFGGRHTEHEASPHSQVMVSRDKTSAAASEHGAVAVSGGVASTGTGPTIVVQPGATLNYYADGVLGVEL